MAPKQEKIYKGSFFIVKYCQRVDIQKLLKISTKRSMSHFSKRKEICYINVEVTDDLSVH